MTKIYKCLECEELFNDLVECTTSGTYESDYGVSGEFPNSTPYFNVYWGCPYCKSGETVKLYECSFCGEYVEELEDEECCICYDCVEKMNEDD